jgi:hypothetical protein
MKKKPMKKKQKQTVATSPCKDCGKEILRHATVVANRFFKRFGMYYLPTGTIPTKVATGYVLVHNHVRHTTRTRCASNGFRAWHQKPSDKLEPCECGWSGLPHYRVKLFFSTGKP